MRRVIVIAIALFVGCQQLQAQTIKAMESWAKSGSADFSKVSHEPFANEPLSRDDAERAKNLLEQLWLESRQIKYAQASKQELIRYGELQLKYAKRVYGQRPADGYSLYISMHGGGNAPARVNDQQWANQIRLYTPKEGVYIAPRAPWNDWNMWFKPGLDELFEMLIECAVSTMGVNPDKVYLLGYSAGGDGVWRMAPRMADRWAAASMMAGHPGEASQVNLRNTPFMIWMGENDSAYNRNKLAAHHGKIMDSLHLADTGGYIHQTHIVEGKGHWMQRADTLAIPWMAKHRRNPYPERVVWRQEEVTRRSFYWIALPEGQACSHKMTVIAELKDNEINIEYSDYKHLRLHFNDEMINLDKPIVVRYRGKKIYKGKLTRTVATMSQTLDKTSDLRYIFSAGVDIEL